MREAPSQVSRLIIVSGIAVGVCIGGWLALGLASVDAPDNQALHRYWTGLLVTATIVCAIAHATGWNMRAGYVRQRDAARRRRAARAAGPSGDDPDDVYAAGYRDALAALPDGGEVVNYRQSTRTVAGSKVRRP